MGRRPGRDALEGKIMTFRCWFKDGSARLVGAESEQEAKVSATVSAKLDALDLSRAYTKEKSSNPDRARELCKEWLGLTTVTKVEALV